MKRFHWGLTPKRVYAKKLIGAIVEIANVRPMSMLKPNLLLSGTNPSASHRVCPSFNDATKSFELYSADFHGGADSVAC